MFRRRCWRVAGAAPIGYLLMTQRRAVLASDAVVRAGGWRKTMLGCIFFAWFAAFLGWRRTTDRWMTDRHHRCRRSAQLQWQYSSSMTH